MFIILGDFSNFFAHKYFAPFSARLGAAVKFSLFFVKFRKTRCAFSLRLILCSWLYRIIQIFCPCCREYSYRTPKRCPEGY